MSAPTAEVVICGAGIAGIAAAYHLAVRAASPASCSSTKARRSRSPATSRPNAIGTGGPDPGDDMVALMNRSIDLLEDLAHESHNRFL
jgi:glycine/D-amino acid oxidase-like deaminating enzyme